ncbi:MAG TPA: hypothetical protein VGC82_00895, partial [Rhodopila sp.]
GSHGVVIAAWAGGLACEVEFDEPRHLLVTIKAANLTVTMPNATKPELIRISSFICSIRRVVILYPARLRLFRAQELIDALKRYLSEPSAR